MEYLTTSRAARLANISESGIRYALRTGALQPNARTSDGAALFDRSSIEKWAADRRLAQEARHAGAAA